MLMYWLSNNVFNPLLSILLRSPFRSLLPDNWVILTYTGRKTQKKRSLVFHVAPYNDEYIVVPGCFGQLPNWWRNFRTESKVDMFYKGKTMECLARTIEHDETEAVPRLAEYVRHFHADLIGITPETTEEQFSELVTTAARTYPIVTIRQRSSASGS
ncbi:MAG: nitroreductase/quinone reductase family protein [Candidatus Bathyarchaeota archaeon]|nr:nitroreductase/quinone reductase family protein [Candidatus Bathyarchaeota archaeon]